MAQIFPPWANRIPLYAAVLLAAAISGAVLGAGYYFSPRFTDAGYMPRQPVPFSHRLHAGELKIDCRYCHSQVESSPFASIPPTRTCMNCHELVARKSPKLALVRESAETGEPIHWIRVHKLPEFVYFDHRIHIRAGVGCSTCHGDVAQMEEIRQAEPLSMAWCLDCHRHPEPLLRPRQAITKMNWAPHSAAANVRVGGRRIAPSSDCSACHR